MAGLKNNTEKHTFQLPPIVETYFEFCVWLLQKVSKFPKDHRYMMGARIQNLGISILETLIESAIHKKGQQKLAILEDVNVKLEQLRYLLRLATAIRVLNNRSHHYGSQRLQEMGIMVGGWIKNIKQQGLSYEL